jgi:hypothetical protein
MQNRRLPKWSILVFGLAFVSVPSANAASFCTTHWGRLAVGTVDRNPFTADVRITSWQTSTDGIKRQMGALILFHVARDVSGRVAIQGPLIYGESTEPYVPGGPKSLERRGEPASWQMVLCDPLADTTTIYFHSENSLNRRATVLTGRGSMPGLNHFSAYNRDRMARNGRWIDLGHKNIEGTEGRGYRWWLRDDADAPFVEEDFTEQWISDDLATELSVVKMDRTRNREERAELVHIRRVEADSALFQVPPGFEVFEQSVNATVSKP